MLRSSVSALVVPDGGRVADTRVARIIVRDRTEQWVQSPLGARLEVAVDRASSTRSAIDGRRPVDTCGNVSSGAGPEAAAGDTRAPPYTGARAHRGKWVQTPRGARLEVAADLHRDKSRHGSCPYVTRVLVVITHQVGVVVGTDHPGAFDGEGCRRAPRSVGSTPTRSATRSRSRSHRGDATDTYTSASFRVISRLTKSANHRHRRRGLTFLAGSHPARRANPRRLVQSRRARGARRGRRRPERAIRLRHSRARNGPCRPSNGGTYYHG